jgi:hypothetical protein
LIFEVELVKIDLKEELWESIDFYNCGYDVSKLLSLHQTECLYVIKWQFECCSVQVRWTWVSKQIVKIGHSLHSGIIANIWQ